jgi:phosphoribosyl-ATP pyrophosphohydrolase
MEKSQDQQKGKGAQMSYDQSDSIDWNAIIKVDAWLDRDVAVEYRDQPLAQDWARISKVCEEAGEAIQAFIGYTGQNPRKGTINSKANVLYELADVTFTAILAMQHFAKDDAMVRAILRDKLDIISRRANGVRPPDGEHGLHP